MTASALRIGKALTRAQILAAARRLRRKERKLLAEQIRFDAKVQVKRKGAAYRAVALIHVAHAGRNEASNSNAPLAKTRRLRKAVAAFSRLRSVSLERVGCRRQRRLEWALAGHNRPVWKATFGRKAAAPVKRKSRG
jgi:hypothetical protein